MKMIDKVVVVWASNLDLSVVNLNIQDVLFPIFAVVLSSVLFHGISDMSFKWRDLPFLWLFL